MARSIAVVCLAAAAVALGVRAANGSLGTLSVFIFVAAAYLMVGVLLVQRRPGNAVGGILLAMGVVIAIYLVLDIVIRVPDPPAIAPYLALVVTLIDAPLFAMVAFLFLLFPSGRVAGPRWRWVGLATIGFGGVSFVGTALKPGPLAFYPTIMNPVGGTNAAVGEIVPVFYLLTIGCVGLAALALVGRWRGGGPVERAQLKWASASASLVAAVMVSYAVLFGPENFNDIADLAVGLSFGIFPITIGIAILRYRLFEIDRIISRTIAYVLVTAALVAGYAGVILLLQGPLGSMTGGETIPVAISTLVVAALFHPLRRRVQSLVDRRFDRARFDAERAAAAFAERLRDEVDIDAVTGDLRATVDAALRPTALTLWVRGAER